ncbi:MAG: hypothetical protein HZA51_14950 [Planctomycetes bacterium]|nr:hypothetical protein [Planctomycetota bacterium]
MSDSGGEIFEYASVEEFTVRPRVANIVCAILELKLSVKNSLACLSGLVGVPNALELIIATDQAGCADIMAAIDAGVSGVVSTPLQHELLIGRIRIAQNRAAQRNYDRDRCLSAQRMIDTLTPRELEIAQMIYDGASSKQISASLEISVRTVDGHRAHVLRKLSTDSAAGIIKCLIWAKFTARCDWCREHSAKPGAWDRPMKARAMTTVGVRH